MAKRSEDLLLFFFFFPSLSFFFLSLFLFFFSKNLFVGKARRKRQLDPAGCGLPRREEGRGMLSSLGKDPRPLERFFSGNTRRMTNRPLQGGLERAQGVITARGKPLKGPD